MFRLSTGRLDGPTRLGGGSGACEEPAKWPWSTWAILLVVLIVAAFMRFVDLGRAAVRADEINFLQLAAGGQSLLALWRDPPWVNQIPFADSIPIVWHWFRPGLPSEQTVREPFALLGVLTVTGVAVWLTRRRGIAAGALAGAWMAVLPYHVYHSREAYYYPVVMAGAAGMTLFTASMLTKLSAGATPSPWRYAAWTTLTVLTCLTHMSTWVVALLCWILLVWKGFACLPESRRRSHLIGMFACAVVIGAVMERWIWRAIDLVRQSAESKVHIGEDFAWVAPRVLPFFTAGANALGIVAAVLVTVAGAYLIMTNWRKSFVDRDHAYDALTLITAGGGVLVFGYVGVVGGGLAKLSYFSVLLPVFLTWAAYTLDVLVGGRASHCAGVLRASLPCMIGLALATPAWMITQLDGRPTPYKQLRAWLDENLDAGSVVLIDRWFEPWNELARYAPEKVFVTFTVPDEPYETYRQLRWREVTQQAIEQGKAQAFIRMVRSYEKVDGLWTWPETFFARRATVTNQAGMWLREHGFAPTEEFYNADKIRLVTEIFFDRREDEVSRKRAAGDRFAVFFGPSMRLVKTGPLNIFRIQTEQFVDWRLLEAAGTLEVHNLTDTAQQVVLTVRAVAPAGPKSIACGDGPQCEFSGAALEERKLGPLELEPGANQIVLTDPSWADAQRPLLIVDVAIVNATVP